MPYTPDWTNANAQGRLDPGLHTVCLSDADELVAAINRRRLLVYLTEQTFSTHVGSNKYVKGSTLASATASPFDNFRKQFDVRILEPTPGGLGGDPSTPAGMHWWWPVADADEDKIIVNGIGGVPGGKVGLHQKLNGTANWTDSTLTAGQTSIRAVHWNELRQAAEWISRGQWELPVYWINGIFSVAPDTPWTGELITNDGADELRSLGFSAIRVVETPARGLTNVTVRSGSFIRITADTTCTVDVYRCKREVNFDTDRCTWNEYDPSESAAWASPGALGAADAAFIGSIDLTADTPGDLSSAGLTTALQAMIDGAEMNFLIRRQDTGPFAVGILANVFIEFELDTPPN